MVILWVTLNSIALTQHWDPYPFILLNLAFSTQAAYAAPLILLAQTRQAERDKRADDRAERRHSQMEQQAADRVAALTALLESNTDLTRQDKDLPSRWQPSRVRSTPVSRVRAET